VAEPLLLPVEIPVACPASEVVALPELVKLVAVLLDVPDVLAPDVLLPDVLAALVD
jgi:hypothetical protein